MAEQPTPTSKPRTRVSKPTPAKLARAAADAADRADAAQTVRMSNEVAAKLAGISARWMTEQRTHGCPVPDGGVRTIAQVAAIVRWRMEQQRAELLDGQDMDEDDLEREEKRTKLKAMQIKLARELDLVLDGDDYLHHLSVLWVEMNSLLDVMGQQLGPIVATISDPDTCADKIEEFVADIKKRFNPEEAMNPVRVDLDPFTDDEVGLDLDDDDADDDEA